MIHDQTASVASLARVMLGDVDETREFTSVRSASLRLVLETLIALAEPGHHMKVADASTRTVAEHLKSVSDVRTALDG
jgi:hypothetical protein